MCQPTTHSKEEAHGRAALLQAVDIADHAGADGHAASASERLHDPEEHQLWDGARQRDAQRAQCEYGEHSQIDGPSTIYGEMDDIYG